MERNRKIPRTSDTTLQPVAFELPPDRAFVLHLDVRAQPPRRVVGRVEHVTSGQVAHITSLRELVAFLAAVLRERGPERVRDGYRGSRCQNLSESARGSDETHRPLIGQPTRRGRTGGAES